jgi:hypothetical protein
MVEFNAAAEFTPAATVQPESGPSFPNEARAARRGVGNEARGVGLHAAASETRLVACTVALNARHKSTRASGISSRYAKARHLPCARCHGGARICQRTYERDALRGGA